VQASNEMFPRHEGVPLSPSAGVVWRVSENLGLHVSGQHAFRRPTLNELYRPFRVGNVITEANPNLRTETVTSGEIGAEYSPGPFVFALTAFRDELHDAVANVTVGRGPGTVPGVGFVPAGGEGRLRLNLDRTRVQGVTGSAAWKLSESLGLNAGYLLNDSEVLHAAVAPQLVGLRLAQVPRHSASVGLTWHRGKWTFAPRARYIGMQFEDDLNTLRLGAVAVVDASVNVTLNTHTDLFMSAENLLDERVETGRSADGVVNIGTPRLILVGLRLAR
jgi:outer membrane receptor protein involved in Fe transport